MEKHRKYMVQRSFFFDTHDSNKKLSSTLSEEDWKRNISDDFSKLIKSETCGAYIFHDKDIDSAGKTKGLHVHAIIEFSSPRSVSSVKKLFGCSEDRNISSLKNSSAAYKYLLHITDEAMKDKKHIYDFSELTVIGCDYREKAFSSKGKTSRNVSVYSSWVGRKVDESYAEKIDSETKTILYDINRGDLTVPDSKLKIFSDFTSEKDSIFIWDKLKPIATRYFTEFLREKAIAFARGDRNLKTMYICGAGGSGKSQLSKYMAMQLSNYSDGRFHSVPAPGTSKTYDFASMYAGENVSIFNDISSNAFQLREFFNIFDPHQYSPVSSRNADKDWLAQYAFLTNSEKINDFIFDMMRYSQGGSVYETDYEKKKLDSFQAARRFHAAVYCEVKGHSTYFTVTKPNLNFDESTYSWKVLGTLGCSDVSDGSKMRKVAKEVLKLIGLK